jgi:hypothetical protein
MPSKSISSYVNATDEQTNFFDNLDAYEQLEWAAALSQMALDARNAELARPLDLTILAIEDKDVPY